MKHSILVFSAALLMAIPAFADTSWTGQGSDNLWSNPDNWSRGVPTGAKSENTIFKTDATVEISGAEKYYALDIKDGSRVEFTGNGSISLLADSEGSARGVTVDAGCALVIDGPTLNVWSYHQYGDLVMKSGTITTSSKGMDFYNGATLTVEGGFFGDPNARNELHVTNGASVVVCGGTLGCGDAKIYDGSSVTLKSGELISNGYFTRYGSGSFNFLGGTFRLNTGHAIDAGNFDLFKPPPHAELVVDDVAGAMHTSSAEYPNVFIGGDIVMTNNSFGVTGVNDTTTPANYGGRFNLTARQIYHAPSKSGNTINMRMGSLVLGPGGIKYGSGGASLYFRDGIRFGAFADWGISPSAADSTASTYYPCGRVEFDTLDAFDRTTPRSISLPRLNLHLADYLYVTGGGNVLLATAAASSKMSLFDFSVTDGSRLSLSNMAISVRANSATLSQGSTLELKPDAGQYLDAAMSMALAEGSVKIGTCLPASPAARYPVLFAPAGSDPDLSVLDTTDMPSGYSLAKQDNVVYMTDGTTIAHDVSAATTSARYWTGVSDDVLLNAENWTPEAPDDSTARAIYFDGWSNMTIRAGNVRATVMTVKADAGPLKIVPLKSGNYVRFGASPTIVSSSSYPVEVASLIGSANANSSVGIQSLGTGYIALTGGSVTSGHSNKNKVVRDFTFVGDVRLGGLWTPTNVYAIAHDDMVLPVSRLTLLPGASLTTLYQTHSQNVRSTYIVSPGATFTVNGTRLSFTAASETHYVGGTWTVNCPLSATSMQTFTGSGTLILSSVSESAGGVEIAGGLTLVPGLWDAAMPLVCRETATIAPAANWEFAPGGDVSLEIAPRSTLTIDTGANDTTLSAPVTSEGSLVKTGSGKLILDAPGNVIDSLTVEDGTLTIGQSLKSQMSNGAIAFLTVRTLVGDISVPSDVEVAIVQNADGTATYSGRRPKGFVFSIR